MQGLKFDVTGRPDLSERIQKKVFRLGKCWTSGQKTIKQQDMPFLYISYNGLLQRGDCKVYFDEDKNKLTDPIKWLNEEFFDYAEKFDWSMNADVKAISLDLYNVFCWHNTDDLIVGSKTWTDSSLYTIIKQHQNGGVSNCNWKECIAKRSDYVNESEAESNPKTIKEKPKEERVTIEGRLLKREFEDVYYEFIARESSCSCINHPPCGHCTHPGNPANLIECDECFDDYFKTDKGREVTPVLKTKKPIDKIVYPEFLSDAELLAMNGVFDK